MKGVIFILILFPVVLFAQSPAGYYDSVYNKFGDDLYQSLYDLIKNHNQQDYDDAWSHFKTIDATVSGKVWDIYSDNPGGTSSYTYSFTVDKCGNYNSEGDCYNREHSFPKSWFDDNYPMYSDLFALYPTDGYVNNKRANYSFGEVSSSDWTSSNGSKVGNCSFPGYSDKVFEPIDEYKGDLARTYFYMITRYKNSVSGWNSDMLSGSSFSSWALDMLLEWHYDDTVSQKETDRNDAIYAIQNNRNPFIDYPEWIDRIWGIYAGVAEKKESEVKIKYSNGNLEVLSSQPMSNYLIIYNYLGSRVALIDLVGYQRFYPIQLKPGFYIASYQNNTYSLIVNSRIR
ncbi:endonuclease [Cytophagaceae bacterium AH-315-L13]|nr:endonuclease [Cytophagaceae bacterium AH-315-L13]